MVQKLIGLTYTEEMHYTLPEHMSDKVRAMVEAAVQKYGRGKMTRAAIYIKENYGEWYDYLEEESPK